MVGRDSVEPVWVGRDSIEPVWVGRDSVEPVPVGRDSVEPVWVGRDSVEPESDVAAVAPGSTESRPTYAHKERRSPDRRLKQGRFGKRPSLADFGGQGPSLQKSQKTCILPKIFRTAARSRCQINQVKAIRAAARCSYLVFLRVRCPNPFFGISAPSVADDSVNFS